MGPPRSRSLVLLALLLFAALAAFFCSSHAAHTRTTTPHQRLPRAIMASVGARPTALTADWPLTADRRLTADQPLTVTPPPPPRRLVTLSCAKAGPHWHQDHPKTTTPAIELLPYPFGQTNAASSSSGIPPRRRLEPFAPADVRLLNGTAQSHLARAQATNLRYLLSLRPDDLLFAWRKQARQPQPSGARPLRGWEAPGSELRGHILGHWLSASAMCWATSRDPALLRRMAAAVEALAACQEASGWLSAFPEEFLTRVEELQPVWAPYYTLHKLLQGLLDQHQIVGSALALRCALRLAFYIERRGVWRRLDRTAPWRMAACGALAYGARCPGVWPAAHTGLLTRRV